MPSPHLFRKQLLQGIATRIKSAATLDLSALEANSAIVEGTTNVTNATCAAKDTGKTIMLKFAGILTFTDGNNLALAGNLVTTADDVIVLHAFGDGVWTEIARSVN